MAEMTGGTTRREFVAGVGATVGAVTVGAGLVGCGSGSATKTSKSSMPTRGGTLRVAVAGGGQAETLNPVLAAYDNASALRTNQLFEWLVVGGPNLAPQLQLAESMEPNADGTRWTARLRDDVRWHDGTPITADDLMYTLRYVNHPQTAATESVITGLMDTNALKKLDARTVSIPMKQPIGDLPALMIGGAWGLIQDGTKNFNRPIGTGPFKFESWSRGVSSSFVKNPHYWVQGEPLVDRIEILSIADDTARLNALLAGTVDVIGGLGFPAAKEYVAQASASPIKVLISPAPQSTTITMGVAHRPFNDVRVRQALRLIVDRPQMVADAQFGFGQIANDLPCLGVPYYDAGLPQRDQDIEQARSLLKSAGYTDLTLVLNSCMGGFFPGQLESATLFAQQAAAAGVHVQIQNLPPTTYYTKGFPNYPFGQVQWTPATLPVQYLEEYSAGATLNGCQWNDPTTAKLISEALGTVDQAKATELWASVQKLLWESGPEIWWGMCPIIDAVSHQVGGVSVSRAELLNNFNLRRWYLT